jgi:hypothetical protein
MNKLQEMTQKKRAAIDWVERMRSDGFVFALRGDPGDLNNYDCRKDLSEGDDTDKLIALLGRDLPLMK